MVIITDRIKKTEIGENADTQIESTKRQEVPAIKISFFYFPFECIIANLLNDHRKDIKNCKKNSFS